MNSSCAIFSGFGFDLFLLDLISAVAVSLKDPRLPLYLDHGVVSYILPEGPRSCYTIFNREEIGVCPTILDLISHSEYERRFGYRKR